jgi:hypothetical protein
MKKTGRFVHFDDAGGGGIQPRMVRELRSENKRIQAELGGVPTEDQKALSRKLEEMIESARRESNLQLPDKKIIWRRVASNR